MKKRKLREVDRDDREEGLRSITSATTVNNSFYKFPSIGISAESLTFTPQPLQSRDLYGHHSARAVTAVEFSSNGSWFVSGGNDGRVLLWPTRKALDDQWTPKPIEMEIEHNDDIFCVAFSPNNDRVFSCGSDCNFLIHDANT